MDGETYNVAQKHSKSTLNENNFISFPYGDAQKLRDAESGYPASASTKDMHEWAQSYVNPKTGATRTPWEVKQIADAEQEQELQETWEKTKAFKVTD